LFCLSCFSSRNAPPPVSTLSPYTTLFRSGCTTVSVFANDHLAATSVVPLGGDNITKDLSIGLRTTTVEAENIKENHGHAFYDAADRKSTRLNSSHVSISYAVFCLKKKSRK